METELTSNFPNQIVSQLKTKEQEANIMIISDLQYIENVDNSEVLGGGGWKDKYKDYYKKYKKNTAEAVADACCCCCCCCCIEWASSADVAVELQLLAQLMQSVAL